MRSYETTTRHDIYTIHVKRSANVSQQVIGRLVQEGLDFIFGGGGENGGGGEDGDENGNGDGNGGGECTRITMRSEDTTIEIEINCD
jgi:hypothetical protein